MPEQMLGHASLDLGFMESVSDQVAKEMPTKADCQGNIA